MTVVFETPGWLSMDAITTFGLNAKPGNKSPIGYFGTGLKYALAVLLREGCKVAIIVGNRRWDFDHEVKEFRGEKFGYCHVTLPGYLPWNRKREQLPFTTDLGKGWVMWQAFRELFSNTLDESGETYLKDDGWVPPREESRTFILVEGEAFEKEFHNRWETFLMDGERKVGGGVQVLVRPSNHVYYRGVKVHQLKRPSLFTYNILDNLELTEDRTAKYGFYVDNAIKRALINSDDDGLLNVALNASSGHYEHGLDFTDYTYVSPSTRFSHWAATSSNVTARKLVRRIERQGQEIEQHYTEVLAECITEGDWDLFTRIAQEHSEELFSLLMACRPASNEPDAEMITRDAGYSGMGEHLCDNEESNYPIAEAQEGEAGSDQTTTGEDNALWQ